MYSYIAYLITNDLVFKPILGAVLNVTAELGSSTVLTCPIYSVPYANVTWQFANNSDIHYNNNRRVKVLSILCCRMCNGYRFHILYYKYFFSIIPLNVLHIFHRFFQLRNGSLLITKVTSGDNQHYRYAKIIIILYMTLWLISMIWQMCCRKQLHGFKDATNRFIDCSDDGERFVVIANAAESYGQISNRRWAKIALCWALWSGSMVFYTSK